MKKILIVLILAILLYSCTDKTKYTINGTYEGINGEIYMFDIFTNETIDSIIVEKGKFSFEGNIDTPRIVVVYSPKEYHVSSIIVLEPGSSSINIRNPNLNKFNKNSLNTKLNGLRLMYEDDTLSESEINSATIKCFRNNKNNILGVYTLDLLDNIDQFELYYTEAEDYVKNHRQIQFIHNRNIRTIEGAHFVDFPIFDLNSDSLSLSDYVGKGNYVLVNFWYSKNKKAIPEMENLKYIYQEFKGNNLEILGISIGDKEDIIRELAKQHNFTWPMFRSYYNQSVDLYNIRVIPQTILFGTDGKILARDLVGDNIRPTLNKYLPYIK